MSESDPVKIAARAMCDNDILADYGKPCRSCCENAERAIRAIESAGFKIVAREATEEMMDAGGTSQFRNWSEAFKHNMKVYKKGGVADCQWLAPTFSAMIDAAPAYSTPDKKTRALVRRRG